MRGPLTKEWEEGQWRRRRREERRINNIKIISRFFYKALGVIIICKITL